MREGEQAQAQHYDQIAEAYNAHYADPHSVKYASVFIHEPMFRGIPLRNARVLDALCGSGQNTAYLLARGADVTGLDISREQIVAYQTRWPGCRALKTSLRTTR